MPARSVLKAAIVITLCLAMTKPASGQSCRGPQGQVTPCVGGNSAAIILIITGVAATAAVIYGMKHRPHKDQGITNASVVGCVQKTDAGTFLKNEKDNLTYGIIADTVDLKDGERVEVSGRKFRDREGKLNLDVDTLVNNYGPCPP